MQTTTTTLDRTAPHDGATVLDLLTPGARGLLVLDWSPMVRAERVERACRELDRARRTARPVPVIRKPWSEAVCAMLAALVG